MAESILGHTLESNSSSLSFSQSRFNINVTGGSGIISTYSSIFCSTQIQYGSTVNTLGNSPFAYKITTPSITITCSAAPNFESTVGHAKFQLSGWFSTSGTASLIKDFAPDASFLNKNESTYIRMASSTFTTLVASFTFSISIGGTGYSNYKYNVTIPSFVLAIDGCNLYRVR